MRDCCHEVLKCFGQRYRFQSSRVLLELVVEACWKNNERQVDVTITASAWQQQMRRTRRTEPRRIRVLGARPALTALKF